MKKSRRVIDEGREIPFAGYGPPSGVPRRTYPPCNNHTPIVEQLTPERRCVTCTTCGVLLGEWQRKDRP